MPSYLLVFFTLLSLFWAHVIQAQDSSALCTEGYEWASGPSSERQPRDIDYSVSGDDRRSILMANPLVMWRQS